MGSDSEVEDVTSDPAAPLDIFSEVPYDVPLKLKVGTKKFSYTLKKGKKLPYMTTIKGRLQYRSGLVTEIKDNHIGTSSALP